MNLALGFLGGMAVAVLTSLLLALAEGRLALSTALIALLLGLTGGYFVYKQTREFNFSWKPLSLLDIFCLFFFLLFCFRHTLWIFYYKEGFFWTLNPHQAASLNFHLGLIQSFVQDAKFWPENLYLANASLHFPLGMDLLTAIPMKLGMPLMRILPLLALLCALLTGIALFVWARGWALAFFLFGSIASPLLLYMPIRGYHFALPVGLFLLWSWRQRFFLRKKPLPWYVEGFFWGILPLFQIYTFLFLTFVFVTWSILTQKIKSVLKIYYLAIALAIPLLLKVSNHFQMAGDLITWNSDIWDLSSLAQVLLSFGFFIPLILWALWWFWSKKEKSHWFFMAPSLMVFLFLPFIRIGYQANDNIQWLFWAFVLLLPLLYEKVIKPLEIWKRGLIYLFLFVAGFVGMLQSLNQNQEVKLFSAETRDRVCQTLRVQQIRGRVATAQSISHPVSICGYSVVAGDVDLLRDFGFDAEEVEIHLEKLMYGEADWQASARALQAKYVYWGKQEEETYPESLKPWADADPPIAEGPWGAIYDLRLS